MSNGIPKSATERSRAMRKRMAARGLRRMMLTVPVSDEAWFRARAAERCAAWQSKTGELGMVVDGERGEEGEVGIVLHSVMVPFDRRVEIDEIAAEWCELRTQQIVEWAGEDLVGLWVQVPARREAEMVAYHAQLRTEHRRRAVWVESRMLEWIQGLDRMPLVAEQEVRRAELRVEYDASGVDPDHP